MSQSKEKSKILFIAQCTQGHMNYCIPIANRIHELYGDHSEVHFAVNEEYNKKLQQTVPNAKSSVYETKSNESQMFSGNSLIDMMQQLGALWCEDTLKMSQQVGTILLKNFQGLVDLYPAMDKIIEDIKPDLIIFDQLCTLPFGIDRGIKWVNLFSFAKSFCSYHTMPPPKSGLSPENVAKWEDFIDKAYRTGSYKLYRDRVNEFLMEKGVEGLNDYFVLKFSPWLNIYCWPLELDYQEEDRQLPGKWARIESPVVKPLPVSFPVPEKLMNLPGKLIYFSLGSMASVYKPLMQKILDVLEQMPHRFIVSTGMIGDEYEMKANMYGEKYLNQYAVLQTVDMVISHGGNNTLTETFYFGKPLIICPLFGDQPDNAQRVHEEGLGKRVSPFAPPEKLKKDLEDAIEYCSRDSVILKMKKASERIQKDSGLDRVCEELMKIAKK